MTLQLSGLRVLDLTRALSGPFSTMILGDLGAEVIKVEPTPGGDMVRQWGPFDHDISVYYLSANRNKRGIEINFRAPEGLALIRRLALQVDVVVENFKVGTMESMGLSYDTLAAEHPGLIMASISGFGRTGPACEWAGFDQIAQGYSGFMSLSGTPESGPMRVGTAIGDLTSGMWLVIGILSAVIERQRTGRGQHVDTSLLASLMGLLSVQGQRYLSVREIPQPSGNLHPVIAPYGTFEAADGPINLAPATQAMWLKLCDLLELQHLTADPRFLTNAERMQNRHELKRLLEERLRTRSRMDWTRLFIDHQIPAGPINNLEDVFNDEQVKAAGLVESIVHPLLGELEQVGLPIRSSNDPQRRSIRRPPPILGEHTREVLLQFGLVANEIDALLRTDVVKQFGYAEAANDSSEHT
ncbi:CaiB/BaiF CoA transferase family protein [Castellaniella sp.]|uniref:CaiB/BaiF CoA transferase family protein n=1 Tax=Castellaniella sp. TaxID=1955812 RepID=UPI003561CA8F